MRSGRQSLSSFDLGMKALTAATSNIGLGLTLDEFVGARDLRREPVAHRLGIDAGIRDVRARSRCDARAASAVMGSPARATCNRGNAGRMTRLEEIIGAGEPILEPLLPRLLRR